MILQWYFNGTPTILPWYSNNTPMVLPWYFNDTPTVLPWYFNDTPKLQYSNGTSMVLPWYFNGTPMVLQWYSHGTSTILQRYSHGTPLILQLFFGVSEVSLFPPWNIPSKFLMVKRSIFQLDCRSYSTVFIRVVRAIAHVKLCITVLCKDLQTSTYHLFGSYSDGFIIRMKIIDDFQLISRLISWNYRRRSN